MNVSSFSLSYLNNNELHRLSIEVIETIDEFMSANAMLQNVRNAIEARATDLRRALDRDPKNELTNEIRQADDDRDNAFRALRAGIEFSERHFEEKTRSAGEQLSEVLSKYGERMLLAGYGEQTTLTDALLAALAEPTSVEALKQTNLSDFVARLQQAQDTFKQLVRRRQEADASDDLPPRRITRATLRDHLDFVERIFAFYLVTEPASVEQAVRTLNERTQDILTPAKARHTRNANENVNDEQMEEPVGV